MNKQRAHSKFNIIVFLLLCITSSFFSLITTVYATTFEFKILDKKTNNGISKASIEIYLPEKKMTIIKTTDSNGISEIENIDKGDYSITIKKTGYDTEKRKVKIDFKTNQIVILLTQTTGLKDEITVVPKTADEGQITMKAGRVSAIAGATEDAFKAIKVSPGILSVSEADSRLFIGGSPPSENLILLDGVPIYDPYHLYGLITMFDPETISQLTILPGGFPAKYGNRLSAVVEVYNRYGTTSDWFHGSLNMSFTNSSLVSEGKFPLDKGAGSWMISMRRTYYDVLLNAMSTGPSKFPYFFDFQSRFFYQPSPRHEFSLFSIYSFEGTDLTESVEREFTMMDFNFIDKQTANIHGFHYFFRLSKDAYLESILSYYENHQKSNASVVIGKEAFITSLKLELKTIEWNVEEQFFFELSPSNSIESGIQFADNPASSYISIKSEDPAIVIPDELNHFQTDSVNKKFGFYIQDKWQLNEENEMNFGVRWDKETLSGMKKLSPRLQFSHNFTENFAINTAWGVYYHFPSYEALQGESLLFDLNNIDELNLKPEKAIHYLLGLSYETEGETSWKIDLYRKQLSDLIVGKTEIKELLVLHNDGTTSMESIETTGIEPINDENGYSQGIELSWQKQHLFLNKLDIFAAYSYAETKARRTNKEWHYRRYDQRHTINVIGEYHFNRKWWVNFVWHFGSGFPYTPPGKVLTVVEDLNENGHYDPKDGERLSYIQVEDPKMKYTSRYPFYHRFDFRCNFTLKKKNFDATFYLDIINLYDHNNIQAYEYNKDFSEKKSVSGLPLLPTIGIHFQL